MAKVLRYAARSDVGKIRSKNDDSAYAGHYLAVVADGMGGHAGGNIASASTVLDLIHLDEDVYDGDAGTALADEIQTANSLLSDLVRTSPQLAGMGTTVTALLLSGDTLHFAHIGDSRAYRLKDGVFEQISVDHTFVQRLIDEGRLHPDEAETHPHKNVLMRVLGDVDASPELDLSEYDAAIGERWLLCSDGLNAVVDAQTIESVVRGTADITECADRLVELTLQGSAPDNVTVVVVEVAGETTDDVDTTSLSVLGSPEENSGMGRPAAQQSGAGREQTADGPGESHGSDHLNAEVLREELRARPHVLVGSAAMVAETGEIPTIAKRTAERRAATLLTHRSSPEADPAHDDDERSSRRWWWYGTAAAVLVLLIAAALWAGYAWTQTRYYVAENDGHVAIYNGVSQSIGPISLSHLETTTDIEVADLPRYTQQRLARTLPADSLGHAYRIVHDIRSPRPEDPAAPGCPTPTASPTTEASDGPSGSPRPNTDEPDASDASSSPAPGDPSLPARCGGPS